MENPPQEPRQAGLGPEDALPLHERLARLMEAEHRAIAERRARLRRYTTAAALVIMLPLAGWTALMLITALGR